MVAGTGGGYLGITMEGTSIRPWAESTDFDTVGQSLDQAGLPLGMRILAVGCGTGIYPKELLQL